MLNRSLDRRDAGFQIAVFGLSLSLLGRNHSCQLVVAVSNLRENVLVGLLKTIDRFRKICRQLVVDGLPNSICIILTLFLGCVDSLSEFSVRRYTVGFLLGNLCGDVKRFRHQRRDTSTECRDFAIKPSDFTGTSPNLFRDAFLQNLYLVLRFVNPVVEFRQLIRLRLDVGNVRLDFRAFIHAVLNLVVNARAKFLVGFTAGGSLRV